MCQPSRSPDASTTNSFEHQSLITRSAPSCPERVWRLLTECPQISIGLNRQFNGLSLADLWDHNGASLARIRFLLPTVTQNQNEGVGGAAPEQSLFSVQVQRSPDAPAKQPVTLPQITLPATVLTEITNQCDVATSIEPTSIAFDEQTPFASDEQSRDVLTRQGTTRCGGRTRQSSSRYTTEIDVIESPRRSAPRASREITRNPSVRPAKANDNYPQTLMLHTRPSRIDPRFRPQRSTQESSKPPRHGGSRKYLRGTEGFWNEMFWHARNQCEGQVTGRFTAGRATHPGARALYANRPAGVDAILLGAIEAGLPVPIYPQDITDSWRDRTAWVLERSQSGVYVTPGGVRRVDSSQYADHSKTRQSQIVVLRSDRLREVDFSEKGFHLNTQQSPSSAAHTLRHQRFFSLQPTAMTGPFGPQPPASETKKNLDFLIPAPSSDLTPGPRLGVLHLSENDGSDISIPSIMPEEVPTPPVRRNRRRRASAAAANTSPAAPMSRATTIGLESPALAEERCASPEAQSWRGLPPPLTTRSRKRKMSENLEAAKQSPKRRKQNDITADVSTSRSLPVTSNGAIAHTSRVMIAGDAPSTPMPLNLTLKQTQPQMSKTRTSNMPHENRKEVFKQTLLEVIEDCGGMVPNDYSSISDYMTTKYRAKGKSGQLDKKMCRDVINSLCTNGRLKRLGFTFQKTSGAMATSKILANIDVDATSEAVMRLQQNIINARPDIYIPPLGSVLDAPLIEAPLPDTTPAAPPDGKRSSAGKISTRTAAIRRPRVRHGTRHDHFGASPARRPFSWQGQPHLILIEGSEDDLSLAFSYVATNRSQARQAGQAVWANAEAGPIDAEPLPTKRKTTIPKSQVGTRARQLRDPDTADGASAEYRVDSLNWRTEKPVRSLTFDPEAHAEPTNEDTTAIDVPKFGRSSRGRKIIWKTRDSEILPPSLPSSLQDILDMPGQIPTIDYSMTKDPDSNFFHWELDAVEYWEGNILKIYQQRASEWTFINHWSKQQSIPSLPGYPRLQWEELNVLTPVAFTPRPTHLKRGKLARKQRQQKVLVEQDDESVDSDYDPAMESIAPAPLRRSRRKTSLQPARHSNEPATKPKPSKRQFRPLRGDGQPLGRQGRPRILQSMASEEIYRIVVAVIVVRTLVGGITGKIDWSIVQKLCPNRDEAFLTDRWSTLVIKNRRDIANLTESMQKKYIIAYEKGEVPCISFANTQHSDWEAIISWAERSLDKNVSDEIEALPSTRAELLRTMNFTFAEPKTLRDALGHTGYQSQAIKEEILAKTPAAVQLQGSSDTATSLRIEPEVEEEDSNLSLAKSWAVSTVMTSEESLDPATVTEKLSNITPNKKEADQLFDRALKVLQQNQVIKRTKGATKGPWRASERWFEMFDTKRMITATMLKRAAAWKRDVLDPAVHAGQSVLIDKTQIMQDGEMVAIVNMVANRRCKITAGPAGLPRGRYGLDPDATNYNTKGMGRLLTLFATMIRPTQEYVVGDPMAAQRLEIPSWQDNGQGKIPCWIDMNGHVLQKIWEMVISAVVGLLSGRPGISPVEIERTLGHGVTKWEIEIVLAWLEGSGFAQRTEHGTGWETREWWWMVCGFTDHDAGASADTNEQRLMI